MRLPKVYQTVLEKGKNRENSRAEFIFLCEYNGEMSLPDTPCSDWMEEQQKKWKCPHVIERSVSE